MENLKPVPGEPQLPRGPGLKQGIQLQRHLLLGRHLPGAQCTKSYLNQWKSSPCSQGSPVELPKHRHVALLGMPQAPCFVPSSCSRWTRASCRSCRTFQDCADLPVPKGTKSKDHFSSVSCAGRAGVADGRRRLFLNQGPVCGIQDKGP